LHDDIIFDIMNREKLNKLRQKVEELRKKGGIGYSELESLARALGRVPSKRGKHQTWVNKIFPDLRPLSIPRHGSKDLNKYTASQILDQIELDIDNYEEFIEE
jgi:HicA toxin of bacterial toxin-antitoxin,